MPVIVLHKRTNNGAPVLDSDEKLASTHNNVCVYLEASKHVFAKGMLYTTSK